MKEGGPGQIRRFLEQNCSRAVRLGSKRRCGCVGGSDLLPRPAAPVQKPVTLVRARPSGPRTLPGRRERAFWRRDDSNDGHHSIPGRDVAPGRIANEALIEDGRQTGQGLSTGIVGL